MRMAGMSVAECRLRCNVHAMGLHYRNNEFRVFFPEYQHDKQERTAYYTDDALDAALSAAKMRNTADGLRAKQGRVLA